MGRITLSIPLAAVLACCLACCLACGPSPATPSRQGAATASSPAVPTPADTGPASARTASTASTASSVSLGTTPEYLAISPDGRKIYVTGGDDDSGSTVFLTVDAATRTLLSEPVPVADSGIGRSQIVVSQDGQRIYLAHDYLNQLTVLDARTAAPITTVEAENDSALLSPDGTVLYLAYDNSGTEDDGIGKVSFFDAASLSMSTDALVGGYPRYMTLNQDGRRLYVVCLGQGMFYTADVATGYVDRQAYPVGGGVIDMVVTPDRRRAFLAERHYGVVSFDLGANRGSPVEGAGHPTSLAMHPDGRLFGLYQEEGLIKEIDTAGQGRVRKSIEVGGRPVMGVGSPDGAMLYVLDEATRALLFVKV